MAEAAELARLRAENAALSKALIDAGLDLPAGLQSRHCVPGAGRPYQTPKGSGRNHAAAAVAEMSAVSTKADVPGLGSAIGYTTEGVRVGQTLYPFPKPKYLLQLIQLCEHRTGDADAAPLIKLLAKKRYQHAKEITENFGAVAALRAAVDAAPGLGWPGLCASAVNVYVPGDGRRPFTAAAVCLTTPATWQVWSIDPIMIADYCEHGDLDDLATKNGDGDAAEGGVRRKRAAKTYHSWGGMASRLHCVRGTTEEFVLPPTDTPTPVLSVVLAVHSHCPLSEFVARVPPPVLVISLPCCGTCGLVQEVDGLEPLLSYSDPDILSPHRDVHIHYRP